VRQIVIVIQKQKRKTDKHKTSPNVILETVITVKIHNLSIRQTILEFNTNYRALLQKTLNMLLLWNTSSMRLIVTFSFKIK